LKINKLLSYKVTLYKIALFEVGETGTASIMALNSEDAISQASDLKKKFNANMYKLERGWKIEKVFRHIGYSSI